MAQVQLTTRGTHDVSSHVGSVALEGSADRCTVQVVGEIDATLSWDAIQRLADVVRSAALPVHVDCTEVTFFVTRASACWRCSSRRPRAGDSRGW